MFKNPFSFNGRIRRTEFGISMILYLVVALLLEYVIIGTNSEDLTSSVIFLLMYIPLLWFLIAQSAKRCHDRGNTGWFQIIPFYGLWMLFANSEVGENQYGPNPKGIGNIDEVDQIGNYIS